MLARAGASSKVLEDDRRAGGAGGGQHGRRIDHALAQRPVRVVGVGRSEVAVQMDVSQAGSRVVEEGVEGAADGGVAAVEHEPQLAQLQVAGAGELRGAHARHVLDGDTHADLALISSRSAMVRCRASTIAGSRGAGGST